MDILEQFLRNISYKFPKGYPDINDAQDMLMLEGILKPFDNLSPEAQEFAKAISQKIDLPLTNFFSNTKDRILLRAPEGTPRAQIASQIEKAFPELTRKKIVGSTFKGFVSDIKGFKDNVQIIFKDEKGVVITTVEDFFTTKRRCWFIK